MVASLVPDRVQGHGPQNKEGDHLTTTEITQYSVSHQGVYDREDKFPEGSSSNSTDTVALQGNQLVNKSKLFLIATKQNPMENVSSVLAFSTSSNGEEVQPQDIKKYLRSPVFDLGETLTSTVEPETSTRALEELASDYLTYQIGVYIHIYWIPIMIPIGLVGNTLAFFVMLQKHNRRVSCCLYMAALAVSDTIILTSAGYYYFATVVLDPYYRMEDNDCAVMVYFLQAAFFNGVIIIISMTVDRFIAIRYPLKAVIHCTPRRAKITIAVTICVSLVYNLPLAFISEMVDDIICAGFAKKDPLTEIIAVIHFITNSLMAFIVILSLNVAIIISFRKHQRSSIRNNSNHSLPSASSTESLRRDPNRQETQLTAMLLMVTFAFLFLTLPQHIRYAVYTDVVDQRESESSYALYVLIYHITNKLFYTNSAVNFFLYCASGPKFRMDLKNLCSGRAKMPKDSKFSTIPISGSQVSMDQYTSNDTLPTFAHL